MGVIDKIKASLGIKAALSPQQMSGQKSKSLNKTDHFGTMFNIKYRDDGLTYEDYERMLEDPQIKSGYELIRMFLLSRKLKITAASEDESDVEIADKVEKMFDNMKYPFRKIRNDLYTALIYGYSVGEVIWEPSEDGSLINLTRIRPIPISTLEDCFKYNNYGDVETIIQTVDDEEIEIPVEKCLIYTYDEKFGNREGTSILDAVYDNWFQKQKILNWWNVFLQKHEGPTLLGKVENPIFKDLMLDQLEKVTEGRANITIGLNDDVSVLESSHRGEGFKDAIDYHDTMIFRKMNIGTMILGQQDGKGAYAQSQTQFDALHVFLDGIHEDIAAELQVKLNQLIDINWEGIENYPTVSFETFEEEDLLGLLTALKPYVDNGSIMPDSMWFRQLLADIVSRYSDVDVSELLEEPALEPISDNTRPGVITPEQQNLADQIDQAFGNEQKPVTPEEIEAQPE